MARVLSLLATACAVAARPVLFGFDGERRCSPATALSHPLLSSRRVLQAHSWSRWIDWRPFPLQLAAHHEYRGAGQPATLRQLHVCLLFGG